MLEKLVSILFAVVTLFAACTRNLADAAGVGMFVVDLCLLAAWCAFIYFQFAHQWRLASPGGYILMIATGILFLFQIRFFTAWGMTAFLIDIGVTATLITMFVLQIRGTRRYY